MLQDDKLLDDFVARMIHPHIVSFSFVRSVFRTCLQSRRPALFLGIPGISCDLRFRMIEGSLEVKLPTIWTDEKQRWEESERREE